MSIGITALKRGSFLQSAPERPVLSPAYVDANAKHDAMRNGNEQAGGEKAALLKSQAAALHPGLGSRKARVSCWH